MHPIVDDTIAALATPVGEGAIGVVRVSGPDAFRVARTLTELPDPVPTQQAFVRRLTEGGDVLDEAVVLCFVGPHSATGEDVVELHCHGGVVTPARVLGAVLRAGARPAVAGEFSRRALANGRMDLLQVEAVADVIHARSEAAQRLAQQHLAGDLSARIDLVKAPLAQLLTLVEAAIDFSLEEDVFSLPHAEIAARIEPLVAGIDALLGTWDEGRLRHDGVRVALVGRPNAGKSSLLNHLLGQERALVTEVAGTTRDWLEEGWRHNGVLFRLIDTAGLRATEDRVEAMGVARARQALSEADAAVLVVDAAQPDGAEEIASTMRAVPWALVCNKRDLVQQPPPLAWAAGAVARVDISLDTGAGCDDLAGMLQALAHAAGLGDGEGGVAITRARHRAQLASAREALLAAGAAAASGLDAELIALDLRLGLDALGAMTGAVTTEDVLRSIFADFCIGK